MKLIIAGSRTFLNYLLLEKEVKDYLVDNCAKDESIEIISGTCDGADKLGEKFAQKYNIPVIRCYPDWYKFGKSAGPRRNQEMAKIATHCIVFSSGGKGSNNMIGICEDLNIPCKVVMV